MIRKKFGDTFLLAAVLGGVFFIGRCSTTEPQGAASTEPAVKLGLSPSFVIKENPLNATLTIEGETNLPKGAEIAWEASQECTGSPGCARTADSDGFHRAKGVAKIDPGMPPLYGRYRAEIDMRTWHDRPVGVHVSGGGVEARAVAQVQFQ